MHEHTVVAVKRRDTPKRYGPRFVCVPFPPHIHAIHFIKMCCALKYPSIQSHDAATALRCVYGLIRRQVVDPPHTRRLRSQTKRLRTSPLHVRTFTSPNRLFIHASHMFFVRVCARSHEGLRFDHVIIGRLTVIRSHSQCKSMLLPDVNKRHENSSNMPDRRNDIS